MRIVVTTGRGIGATKLSAFDAALWDAGLAGYNLIYLSSVIPAGCEVVEAEYHPNKSEVGWKLYCVISVAHTKLHDVSECWAGLGWAHQEAVGGIFIEETGASQREVIKKIQDAYTEMEARRGHIGTLKMTLLEAPPPKPFSCVIAAAVYATSPWTG